MIDPKRNENLSVPSDAYNEAFEALFDAIHSARSTDFYQTLLGPKVFLVATECIQQGQFLRRVAQTRKDVATCGSELRRAEDDLRKAISFVNRQESYQEALKSTEREFVQAQRQLCDEVRQEQRRNSTQLEKHSAKYFFILTGINTGVVKALRQLEKEQDQQRARSLMTQSAQLIADANFQATTHNGEYLPLKLNFDAIIESFSVKAGANYKWGACQQTPSSSS